MKKEYVKVYVTIGIIGILSFLNIFQYTQNHYNEIHRKEKADSNFNLAMQSICLGIKEVESNERDIIPSLPFLSSATSKAVSVYGYTSYYEKNSSLEGILWVLNNNITNRSNIEEVVAKKDLTLLLPILEKVKNNPSDETLNEELYNLIQENTTV
ncbi:hypothetical protein [Clostridium folliculivorans]|uniref:Uncharacterized protein n=1 Tax=Clostridium folliculivorans TaxID=2886038 RepID=A0A9W6DB34_9CLOT|nr:hypothetical protein [Clostridium folliculivorans]GKU25457.1 hypothetical protein CFOLD11_22830 [Clostridium folliculivorans]GKU28479.1 hypothetical protein CFB3_05850 [Clostridium folliculivorans]